MQYLKEITDWGDYPTPNHTYMVNDAGNCVGYIKTGTQDEIWFKKPKKLFSKSRRKFVKLKR